MPPSVSVSYTANYTDTEIGAAAAIGAQAFNDIVGGKSIGALVINGKLNAVITIIKV